MIVREPAVAGTFYKGDPAGCRRQVEALFAEASAALDSAEPRPELPDLIVGGIVPHAGWLFSGEPAARTIEAVARRSSPSVFVIFGATHAPRRPEALLFDRGCWQTPLGEVEVDERLAQRILDNTNVVLADTAAHEGEHSIEVQVPLIQFRFPGAKIVPILVPPTRQAPLVGQAVGRTLEMFGADAVVLGSTDLTHYGPSPNYRFTPMGVGPDALRWAKEVNDAGVIDAIVRLAADEVVPESSARRSACGGGAVAATLAAAQKLGATRGVVLEHITSAEVLAARFNQSAADAVGYLSAVLG